MNIPFSLLTAPTETLSLSLVAFEPSHEPREIEIKFAVNLFDVLLKAVGGAVSNQPIGRRRCEQPFGMLR